MSWNDVSRLNATTVARVITVQSEADVIAALVSDDTASPIVVSGTRHSQGGHITWPDAVVLDMSQFNKVLSLSVARKTIVVQSGATWDQVQRAANPHGLAVKVMQSSNIFSIGGSVSANVHGRDPSYGPVVETIRSLRVALTSGEIVTASRTENPDLFRAIIGGYGLLGVILTVELELGDNLPLKKSTLKTDYRAYPALLKAHLGTLALHFGRCSIVRDANFLRECYAINFTPVAGPPSREPLVEERNKALNALLFRYSRHSDTGKRLRWRLQKRFVDTPGRELHMSRNNAMRPPIEFLRYADADDTDILQEYFVPFDAFVPFMDGLRAELIDSEVNLLSMTLRYLPTNDETLLNYANTEMIAIVLYLNIELTPAAIDTAQAWTRRLVARAAAEGGTYYLTYQRFPGIAQFRALYPAWRSFRAQKRRLDPGLRLRSLFYEQYFGAD